MDARSLELKFNFNDPLYISTADEPEVLEIKILDVNHFISDPEGLPLVTNEDDQLRLTKKIPKQLPNGSADVVAM